MDFLTIEMKTFGVDMSSKQLFQEIAIDPNCFMLDDVVNALRYEINVFNSRLISQVTNAWIIQVHSNIKQIDDIKLKKKIESLFASVKFRNNLFKNPSRKNYLNSNDWLGAVIESNKRFKFDAIVTQKNIFEDNVFNEQTFDGFLSNSKVQTGTINIQDFESIDAFFKQIEPFLILNKKLIVINDSQWLTANKPTKMIFKKVFDFWQKNGGNEFTVIRSLNSYSFSDEKWNIEIDELSRFFMSNNFNGKFRFHAVEDLQKRTHKRALIGIAFGINAEYGLEYHGKTKRQIWDVMSQPSHDSFYREFYEKEIVLSFPKYKYIKFLNNSFSFGDNF